MAPLAFCRTPAGCVSEGNDCESRKVITDWTDNTDSLYQGGQSRPYMLRRLASSGPVRLRLQIVLYCFLFFLIIYFLRGRDAAVGNKSPGPMVRHPGKSQERLNAHVSTNMPAAQMPLETSWGAPLVWGDSRKSAKRRAKLGELEIRTGLAALVVGTYAKFARRFLSSAEIYFLPDQTVTYYILTDNPRTLEPPVKLGPGRKLTVIHIAELPGWSRLAYRRMSLLADAIRDLIGSEVEYVFCADVDQEFVGPVGAEVLGDLVATLHPELYGMPRKAFPYQVEESSAAHVEEDEGDYYYTSELYGGAVSEVYRLVRACSLLILQDQANGVVARGLEESYLNRYLIDHRPTCVLSPEYSWWDSDMAANVPVPRLVSLGRQTRGSG